MPTRREGDEPPARIATRGDEGERMTVLPADYAWEREPIQPVWARQRQRDDESHTLVTLRDALLPKLISGELCVPDAERIVAEAT